MVDYRGNILLDRFVKPTLPVSDYRTGVTGISQGDLESGERGTFIFPDGTSPTDTLTPCVLRLSADNALSFDDAQSEVAILIVDKIIVGHALWNDLSGGSLSPLSPLPVYFVSPSRFLPLLFRLLC